MAESGEQLLDPASGHSGGVDSTCEHTSGANSASSAWMGSMGFFLFFFVFSDQLIEAGVIKWPPPLKH